MPDIIDLEKLKTGKQTGPLSDEVQDQIMRQAEKEMAEEAAAKAGNAPAPKADDKKDDEPAPKADDKQPTAEEKAAAEAKKKAEEAAAAAKTDEEKAAEQKKADEAILLKKDEELTDTEKARKAEIQKSHEESFEAKVKEYAAKEKISVEEARKDLESEKKILEKYQKEPEKLSRALLSSQRSYTRLQQQIQAEKERAQNTIGENEIVIKGQKMSFDDARDQMVEIYRDSHPTETEQLDDETVFEKAKESWKAGVKKAIEGHKAKLGESAKAKRTELLDGVPESAKPYKKAIEEALSNAPDERLLQDDYDLGDIVLWARGEYYSDEKLKEIEEAAFKRGQEKAKILGEHSGTGRQSAGSSSGAPKPTAQVNPDEEVATLTADQKERALSMFQGIEVWDEARKLKEYVTHLKEVGEWKPASKK